jgi:CobQ-like glutamine amidotransferase family enzyme
MTVALTIVSLLPELLNTNGDAANARVLAARARWAGFDAQVIPVHDASELPAVVDAVVIGSGNDADLTAARDSLLPLAGRIRELTTAGVPILAVGSGWELLSWGIELDGGTTIEGLGLVAGRAVPAPERATDDLVVSTRFGRLVGFENHARHYVGAEASPLGRVLYGIGNGNGQSQEGLVMGDLFCTHLHGPVLARNPGLADHLLTIGLARHGAVYTRGSRSAEVDDIAKAARNQIVVRLGLAAE